MRRLGRARSWRWAFCLTAVALVMASCARNPKRPNAQQVRDILARGKPFAENSFYACLINGYEQGLSLKQVQAECETKLALDNAKGFGPNGRDIMGSFGRDDSAFDPPSVTATCNSGDPRVAGGPDGRGRVQWNYSDRRGTVDFGKYSWGGEGECDTGGCYKGLTEQESKAQKVEAIRAFDAAFTAWEQAKEALEADPDNPALQAAERAAKQKAVEAYWKATEDPNLEKARRDPTLIASEDEPKDPGSAGRPEPGEAGTPCEQALQAAREVIGECQRTGWRSTRCQRLLAKMNHCPDPTIIYVDPDAGYACGAKIDPDAVRQAWTERCRRLARPSPDGPDPCVPPTIDEQGHFAGGNAPDDMCGSLIALIDPESSACLALLTPPSAGPDLQEIIVVALNKIGGPMVFIPNRNPRPPRGPEPRPGPVPN